MIMHAGYYCNIIGSVPLAAKQWLSLVPIWLVLLLMACATVTTLHSVFGKSHSQAALERRINVLERHVLQSEQQSSSSRRTKDLGRR